jgi:flagellar assembly protein FliH
MKAQQVARSSHSAIVMDLGDVEREAARTVSRARAEAEQIVSQARVQATAEAARLREEGRLAGHAEGFAAGQEEGRKQGHDEAVAQTAALVQELVGRWNQTLEALQQNMAPHHADARADLVRLALAVAGRVTHAEGLRNRKVAEATVAEALRTIGAARMVSLHVNPAEIEAIGAYLPGLQAKLRSIESVELVADTEIAHGGCTVCFGGGEIDARLETQMKRIADELLAGE